MEPDEGSASAERDLSPGFASRSHPLPQGASGCTHLLISDRRLRKTRVLSIVAAVPTCRHFQNRGSSKSLYLSRFSRCVHALAPCGRGWPREAKPGEGFLSADADHSSGADFVHATFSHKGRREEKPAQAGR